MKKVVTAAELKVLERIFAAEINGRLPAQFKSKWLPGLQERGMVQPMERKIGGGVFTVLVSGWALTHLGRMTYCATCSRHT